MVSLTDISPSPRSVLVNGVNVDVYGISGRGFASLMVRFPAIGKMMNSIQVPKEELIKMGPEALAAFIAAGTGQPGNEEAEKVAADLPVSSQLDLIEQILKLTFPKGVGPFVKQLQAAGLLVAVETPPPNQ